MREKKEKKKETNEYIKKKQWISSIHVEIVTTNLSAEFLVLRVKKDSLFLKISRKQDMSFVVQRFLFHIWSFIFQ